MDRRLKRLLPIIVVALCGILYAVLYLFTPIRFHCPLRYVTGKVIHGGITCPGCGVTRMLIAELRGDIKAAFAANQAVFILQPFLYFLIFRQIIGYINEKEVRYTLLERVLMFITLIILLLFGIIRNLITFNIISI